MTTWITKLKAIFDDTVALSGDMFPKLSVDEIVAVIEAAEDIDANTGIWYVTDDRAALKKAMNDLNGALAALKAKVEGAEAPTTAR